MHQLSNLQFPSDDIATNEHTTHRYGSPDRAPLFFTAICGGVRSRKSPHDISVLFIVASWVQISVPRCVTSDILV